MKADISTLHKPDILILRRQEFPRTGQISRSGAPSVSRGMAQAFHSLVDSEPLFKNDKAKQDLVIVVLA